MSASAELNTVYFDIFMYALHVYISFHTAAWLQDELNLVD